MATTKVTKYGVARGKQILTVNGHPRIEGAKDELATIERNMRDAGLEPDVRLVEYDIETTVGQPRAYVEPTADAPVEPATSEA